MNDVHGKTVRTTGLSRMYDWRQFQPTFGIRLRLIKLYDRIKLDLVIRFD